MGGNDGGNVVGLWLEGGGPQWGLWWKITMKGSDGSSMIGCYDGGL
jgi:hypothetical protein